MLIRILTIFLFLFQTVKAEILVNSVIKLKDNIPNECGLNFLIKTSSNNINAKVSIKKLENNETLTLFSIESDEDVGNADLTTSTGKISDLIESENTSDNNFKIKGKADQDSMTFFFQDLLINGGTVSINKKNHQIKGPIDSKVRLEYLFCTGEMFLPNYKKNNE